MTRYILAFALSVALLSPSLANAGYGKNCGCSSNSGASSQQKYDDARIRRYQERE